MTYAVIFTELALSRIDEQVEFIAVQGQAPLNAGRWLSRVLAAASSLATMPRRCPLAPESGHHPEEIRSLNVDGFLLLFTVDDEARVVRVLTARHGRQLPRPDDLDDFK